MGVKGRKLKVYSGDFKISAVEEVFINHLGQRETARRYGVTHKMIQTWIRIYLEKGKDYFSPATNNTYKDSINVPKVMQTEPTIVTTRKSRTRKVDESSLRDEIRDELNALRMENAYLKKLNALVRKKERSPIRIKLK